MFDFLKGKEPSVSLRMRETMFGDIAWEQWCQGDGSGDQPWRQFRNAFEARQTGETERARAVLKEVVGTPGFESRVYAQAWHFLRELGIVPDSERAKQVLGVIVEVGLPKGLDVLGAYADHSVRYWNFSGKGVVWDRPDESLDRDIDLLLQVAEVVVTHIGPWDGKRPAAPGADTIRISFITPSGLHFGQGPSEVFMRDELAAPVIRAGTVLLQKLIEKSA